MNRLGQIGLTAAAVVAFVPASAQAAPGLFRPNPTLSVPQVDYVDPVIGAGSAAGQLAPLEQAVIPQAIADQTYLAYQASSDLGGFLQAPVGQTALSSGGRTIVGAQLGSSQIPSYAQAGGGKVQSFALSGLQPNAPPENGKQPVPGQGTPPSTPTPTNNNTVPPPNQGFGGKTPTGTTTTTTTSGPAPTTTAPPTTTARTTTTAPTTTSRAPTTTAPTTTTVPTTTTAATTTTSTTSSGGSGGGGGTTGGSGTCGTPGISITSDHATCVLVATNMAPGSGASEVLTVCNTTDRPFALSLRAEGAQDAFWNDLELGVWQQGAAAPASLPPLSWWSAQSNALDTLAAGACAPYVLELYLPSTAGNGDQQKTAVVDFVWTATGT